MARDFGSPIDMHQLEILNFLFQNLASDPSSPKDGQVYFSTANNVHKGFDGSEFRNFYNADDDFHVRLALETASANDDEIVIWDTSAGVYRRMSKSNFIAGTGGEANTASNVGTDGVGVFDFKDGVDLQFRNIAPASNKLSVSLNSKDIDLDVVPSNISHDALADYVAGQHRVINDSGTSTIELWSANKINTGLSGKSDTGHTHTASEVTDFDTQVRTSRLDQMASPTASVNLNNQTITNLAAPVNDTDAVNKAFVLDTVEGRDTKDSVLVATTSNITLSGEQTIDGVLTSTDRVLVKSQTDASENGIYVTSSGSWTRAVDFDEDDDVSAGAFVFVSKGTDNANSGWTLITEDPITVGTTDLTFTQTSGAGQITAGDALSKTGNILDVNPYTGTGTNRGQTIVDNDSLAVVLGSGANNAAAGNHAHTVGDLSDTTITSITSGEILKWSGSAWVNNTLAEANIQEVITGAATTIDTEDLTVSRALVSNASGKVAVSTVTLTELGYVSGVTSSIQTQLDAKREAKTFTVGDGTNSDFTLTHNKNTRDVSVTVRSTASPYDEWEIDNDATTLDTVTLHFGFVPTSSQFSVVIF